MADRILARARELAAASPETAESSIAWSFNVCPPTPRGNACCWARSSPPQQTGSPVPK
jgi:hypothetical protein